MVERKTRQASAAAIPGFLTTVRGGHAGLTAIGNAWSREIFDGPFYVRDPGPVEPSVSLVLVQSLDGNIIADDPATLGDQQHLLTWSSLTVFALTPAGTLSSKASRPYSPVNKPSCL